MTDDMTVTSHSASLQQKAILTTDHICQIALNWKLSH